jgi:hypothetical protein
MLFLDRGKKDAGREKASRTVNADMSSGSHYDSRSTAASHETASNPQTTSQSLAQLTTGDTPSVDTDILQSASHDHEHASDIAKMIARLGVDDISPTYADYTTGSTSDWSMIVHNDAHSASGFIAENYQCVVEKTWSESEAERNWLMEHDLLGVGAQFE